MLGPRNLPTSCQAGETALPISGSPTRVYARQAVLGGSAWGTPNSSIPIRPPGRTTLASSRHRGGAIVDVAQQVGERERVELAVGKRQLLGLAADQFEAPGQRRIACQPGSGAGQHVLTLVEADDAAAAAPDQLGRNHPRPRGDVEHALIWASGDPVHQRTAPARILAEAHQGADAVIARRELGEQLQRVALTRRLGAVDGGWH